MEVQHYENDQRGAFIIPENGERLGELTYVWQGEDKFAI
ncbi:MAG TPA: GNAT family N-acetyltransferase, partial [Acinetobacter radioresistens]|nr:GNAT family N-acetyltransferase [Acinetobacter radioresistens]